jgi:hypothetical protein
MTPKEKAQELVKKFFDATNIYTFEAKDCALIAVDEIIDFISEDPYYKDFNFWQEVKQEINNL